jgi:prepilin-type processing-associated H-X9-DG protein
LYDHNIPWDAPENKALEGYMPYIYGCPSDTASALYQINYVMITGKGTIGGLPNEGIKMHEVKDGPSNTIVVVEVVGSGIHWLEPRDLSIEDLSTRLNDGSGNSPSSNHPGGLNVLLTDGSVSFIADGVTPATLKNLFGCDDGNAVPQF